jgi:hypothetical protein
MKIKIIPTEKKNEIKCIYDSNFDELLPFFQEKRTNHTTAP